MGDLQTPFTAAFAAPDSGGDNIATRGGFDMGEGSQSETPNALSGLATQPTTIAMGEGDPGRGATIDIPDLTKGGLTIPTKGSPLV